LDLIIEGGFAFLAFASYSPVPGWLRDNAVSDITIWLSKPVRRKEAMNKMTRRGSLKGTTVALLLLGGAISASSAVAQQASDMDAVKAANQAFYAALSARDAGAMEKVWSSDADIENIGPSDKAAGLGWEGVKKSYAGTFSMETEIKVSMEQPRIKINGSIAWVSGIERAQFKNKAGETINASNMAKSIFEKKPSGWLMVYHHASRVPQ
jgi:ketosteroid isomerase-like protein